MSGYEFHNQVMPMPTIPMPAWLIDEINRMKAARDYDNLEVHEAIHNDFVKNVLHYNSRQSPSDPLKGATMESPETLRQEAARLVEQAKVLESLPEDDFEDGNAITFTKVFPRSPGRDRYNEKEYSYAAIKAAGLWFHTGQGGPSHNTGLSRNGYLPWHQLLEFIGFDNLDSIRYVVRDAPLL